MRVRNTGTSPQGLYDTSGRCVIIQPGDSKEISLSAAEQQTVARSPSLQALSPPVGLPAAKPPPSTPAPSVIDSLRDTARMLGVTVNPRWGEKRLRKEIDAVHNAHSTAAQNQAPGVRRS